MKIINLIEQNQYSHLKLGGLMIYCGLNRNVEMRKTRRLAYVNGRALVFYGDMGFVQDLETKVTRVKLTSPAGNRFTLRADTVTRRSNLLLPNSKYLVADEDAHLRNLELRDFYLKGEQDPDILNFCSVIKAINDYDKEVEEKGYGQMQEYVESAKETKILMKTALKVANRVELAATKDMLTWR